MRIAALIAILSLGALPAFAQQPSQPTEAPKATKAEVDQVVASIKSDPKKLESYCQIVKLQTQYQQAEEKKDEQKLKELDTQFEQATKPLGAGFEKIMSSELDEASVKSLEDLSASCKT